MTPESAVPQAEQVAAFFREHRAKLVPFAFTDSTCWFYRGCFQALFRLDPSV